MSNLEQHQGLKKYGLGWMPSGVKPLPELPTGYQEWVDRPHIPVNFPDTSKFDRNNPYIDEVMRCKWG